MVGLIFHIVNCNKLKCSLENSTSYMIWFIIIIENKRSRVSRLFLFHFLYINTFGDFPAKCEAFKICSQLWTCGLAIVTFQSIPSQSLAHYIGLKSTESLWNIIQTRDDGFVLGLPPPPQCASFHRVLHTPTPADVLYGPHSPVRSAPLMISPETQKRNCLRHEPIPKRSNGRWINQFHELFKRKLF